jgi:hypothetical protein
MVVDKDMAKHEDKQEKRVRDEKNRKRLRTR